MKKYFSALRAVPVLAVLAALSFASCAETPVSATSDLVVVSPQSRLYTGKPLLDYESANVVTLTLNDSPISTEDEELLSASTTGLNVLVVTEKDSGGKEMSKVTVKYFLNDLNPVEVDLFANLTAWAESNTGDVDPSISDNALRVQGGSDDEGFGSVGKAYDAGAESTVMMSVEVPTIVNTGGYAAVGFQADATPTNWMAAQVERTADGLTLYIRDMGHAASVRASDSYERSSWTPVTIYFYRNVSYYHAAAVSSNGTVLAAAKVENYNPSFLASMDRRSIILGPKDDSSSSSTLVTADNYFYYE